MPFSTITPKSSQDPAVASTSESDNENQQAQSRGVEDIFSSVSTGTKATAQRLPEARVPAVPLASTETPTVAPQDNKAPVVPDAHQEKIAVINQMPDATVAVTDPLDATPRQAEHPRRRLPLMIAAIAIIVLVVGGVGVYAWYARQDDGASLTNTVTNMVVNTQATTSTTATNTNAALITPVVDATTNIAVTTPVVDATTNTAVNAAETADAQEELEAMRTKDTDNDGLADIEEIDLGTNPLRADTDADGLSDFDEVRVYGTNPNNKDTDADGYLDGEEVTNGYNPNGAGKLLDIKTEIEKVR